MGSSKIDYLHYSIAETRLSLQNYYLNMDFKKWSMDNSAMKGFILLKSMMAFLRKMHTDNSKVQILVV